MDKAPKIHHFLAMLTYTCSCGTENHLQRYFASPTKNVTHITLMPYVPQSWPCSRCLSGFPPFVEVSINWLSDEEAVAVGVPFDLIDPSAGK